MAWPGDHRCAPDLARQHQLAGGARVMHVQQFGINRSET